MYTAKCYGHEFQFANKAEYLAERAEHRDCEELKCDIARALAFARILGGGLAAKLVERELDQQLMKG